MKKENNFDKNFIQETGFPVVVTGMTFLKQGNHQNKPTCIIIHILLSK